MKRLWFALALCVPVSLAHARDTKPVSALPVATTPLSGDERVPIVQNGASVQAQTSAFLGLPVQNLVGASQAIDCTDFYVLTRRSDSGGAMSDTFPASSSECLRMGAWIRIQNADASATLTLTAGTGTTFDGRSTDTVVSGGTALYVWDTSATLWRRSLGGSAALNVGTTAGTVAAGDDSRIVDAISASSADTLSNKTIDGGANTFTNLPAAQLTGTVPAAALPLGPGLQVVGSAVQATGGQTKVISTAASLTLTDADCGARVIANGVSAAVVTLPPLQAGCSFTFQTALANMILLTGGNEMFLPGTNDHPIEAYRLAASKLYGWLKIVSNGTDWRGDSKSNLTFEAAMPLDDQLAAHGQVQFSLDAANSRFRLLPKDGNGLIVFGYLMQILDAGLTLPQSATASNALNYFYVRGDEFPAVTGTSNNGSGFVRLSLTSAVTPGSQVEALCISVLGTVEANGFWTGTAVDTNDDGTTDAVDLIGSSYANTFAASPNGKCRLVYLVASTVGHSVFHGVEVNASSIGGISENYATLVGMAWIDGSGLPHDTATQRDVAGRFHPQKKTCRAALTADATTTSSSWTDMAPSKHCEFVTFGLNDTNWRAVGGATMSAVVGSFGGGFDGTTPQPEQIPVGHFAGQSAVASGSATLTEGKHYLTILGQSAGGNTLTVTGVTPPTMFEVEVWQ